MTETATFAAGCFWCTEAIFQRLKGVQSAVSGYTGGAIKNPHYDAVSSGTTGHAEAIQITFDPHIIPYSILLDVFWATHDPTSLNQQGPDVGTQYRSAIFYHHQNQKRLAEKSKLTLEKSDLYQGKKVVTDIIPISTFYPAETYHQNYYNRQKDASYCQIIINPKLAKLKDKFQSYLKPTSST